MRPVRRWTWHRITHILPSQQNQSRNKNSEKGPAGSGIELLTPYQANKIRVVEVRTLKTLRRGIAGPSLTYCQANITRVDVRTVRGDTVDWHKITCILSNQQNQSRSKNSEGGPAGSGIESLTSCQFNRIRVEVRTVRRDTAIPGMELLTS